MNHRPQISNATRPLTFTVEARNERGETLPTDIAGEHPLTLYVDKREIVTLMTLGAAPEALAIGYLRNQRLVGGIEEIVSVQVDWNVNAVAVTTKSGMTVRMPVGEIRETGRGAQGVRVTKLDEGDKVVAAARVAAGD